MQHTPTKVVTSQRFSFSEDRLAYKVASDDVEVLTKSLKETNGYKNGHTH